MNRYVKIFALDNNLYAEKSPLCIVAGVLLQDNTTGKLLIQLKLRNVSCKTIKAVSVGYCPKGANGENIGEKGVFSYVDLHVERDAFFGTQTPIYLSESTARSFSVRVERVVYVDNTQTVLGANEEQWQSLPQQELLEKEMTSVHVRQQYLREARAQGSLCLTEERDLWLCTCGAVNRAEETKCHSCGGILENLQTMNIEALEVRAQQHEEERKKEIEVAEKEKRKKIGMMVAAALLVVVIVLGLCYMRMKPYCDAKRLLKTGDSYSAYMAFDALGEFKDSEKMAEEAEMQNYIDQALSGEYGDDMFAYWRSKTETRYGYVQETYYNEMDVVHLLSRKDWYEICVGDTFGRKLSFGSYHMVQSFKIKDFISMETDENATDSFSYEFDGAGKESKGVCRIRYTNEKTGYWLCHVEEDLIILRGHGGETVLLLRDQGKWFNRWLKCIEFYELK